MSRLGHIAACLIALVALAHGSAACAQQLDARFSCSAAAMVDGEAVTYADNGEMRLDGTRILAFRWESSLFRSTHGFDCSIDESDGLAVEATGDAARPGWRVRVTDAAAARERRGYDFATSMNCTLRIARNSERLHIRPSCPALCGSRKNFSELSVDLKTGTCRYEE